MTAYNMNYPRPQSLVINTKDTWAMKFNDDGSLEVNPELTMDEAAKGVIEALRPYLVSMYWQHVKPTQEVPSSAPVVGGLRESGAA